MKKKVVLSLAGILLVSLVVLAFGCGGTPAEEKPAAPATPTAPAEPTKPAEPATPAPAPSEPPAITHSLEGQSDCLMCHTGTAGVGAPGGMGVPASHASYKNEICSGCHKPKS